MRISSHICLNSSSKDTGGMKPLSSTAITACQSNTCIGTKMFFNLSKYHVLVSEFKSAATAPTKICHTVKLMDEQSLILGSPKASLSSLARSEGGVFADGGHKRNINIRIARPNRERYETSSVPGSVSRVSSMLATGLSISSTIKEEFVG